MSDMIMMIGESVMFVFGLLGTLMFWAVFCVGLVVVVALALIAINDLSTTPLPPAKRCRKHDL